MDHQGRVLHIVLDCFVPHGRLAGSVLVLCLVDLLVSDFEDQEWILLAESVVVLQAVSGDDVDGQFTKQVRVLVRLLPTIKQVHKSQR